MQAFVGSLVGFKANKVIFNHYISFYKRSNGIFREY
ncbi:hypothetical protein ACFVT8_16420 [Lysinibacillus sp. NPDC058147]